MLGSPDSGTSVDKVMLGAAKSSIPPARTCDSISGSPPTKLDPAGEAYLEMITKQGTNNYHGSLFGYFRAAALDTDDKYSYTFSKPGTYPYYCSIHPKMVGKIVVQ